MAVDVENDLFNIAVEDDYSMNSLFDRDLSNETSKKLNQLIIKRPKPALKCVVCGDHAFGYNFDAVSCESCKAFFRRNALRPPGKLRCRGNGHCEVTVEKRKRCKKCRLDKCFKMAMRKEWILSEDEKRKKKTKIEENRRQKRTHENGPVHRRRSLKSIVKNEDISISDGFCYQPVDDHPTIDDHPTMTEFDWSCICRVQSAYSQAIILNRVIGVPPYPATQPIGSTLELIRIPTYLASIRLITYLKHIPEFDLFDPEDRVVLVKHNLLAVVFMHTVLLYDPIADTYHEHNTEDPIFQGKDWIKILGEEFYRELTDLGTKLIEICQYDRVIIKIFLLLILFTKGFCGYDIAHEPSLRNHSVVFNTQNRYLETLYRYCLHQYGFQKTVTLFSRSVDSLLSIQRLAINLKDIVHHQVDASQLSPLMQSVLQLTDSNSPA